MKLTMKIIRHLLLSALICPLWAINASGQGAGTSNLVFSIYIPEIALIDVEPSSNPNISVNITPPSEAGKKVTIREFRNKSLWLNYTSAKAKEGNYRKVNVRMDGSIPEGIVIKLRATSGDVSQGKGELGRPSGQIILSNTPQQLISDIGGAYTGNGINCGHQLQFTFEISDYGLLQDSQNSSLQLVYTLTDN